MKKSVVICLKLIINYLIIDLLVRDFYQLNNCYICNES